MQEENIESQETSETAADSTSEQETEQQETSENEQQKEMIEKSKYDELHGRVTRIEAENKLLKEKTKSTQNAEVAKKETINEEDIEARVELRIQGFSRDEIQKISGYAKANKMSLYDAAKDEFVLAGVNALRAKEKSKEANPPSNARGKVRSSTSFSKMSEAERAKNYSFEAWKSNRNKASRA